MVGTEEHNLLDGGMGSGGGKSLTLNLLSLKRKIMIYSYLHLLSPDDVLTDGPKSVEDKPFELEQGTKLIWIDLEPEAKFAHSTAYVLVTKSNTRIEKGNWYPVLNGKKILYGEDEPVSVIYL